jgi:rubrerythrin
MKHSPLDVGTHHFHFHFTSNILPGDETFDLSVDKPLWVMISIRDRALVGKHDTVGRAYLCLDPKRFGDLLTHDLWMDLDSQGRILLRVSMEGEKDDIQFYFGRAFRSLKRAEADMVRIFIDKVRQTRHVCFGDSFIVAELDVTVHSTITISKHP